MEKVGTHIKTKFISDEDKDLVEQENKEVGEPNLRGVQKKLSKLEMKYKKQDTHVDD